MWLMGYLVQLFVLTAAVIVSKQIVKAHGPLAVGDMTMSGWKPTISLIPPMGLLICFVVLNLYLLNELCHALQRSKVTLPDVHCSILWSTCPRIYSRCWIPCPRITKTKILKKKQWSRDMGDIDSFVQILALIGVTVHMDGHSHHDSSSADSQAELKIHATQFAFTVPYFFGTLLRDNLGKCFVYPGLFLSKQRG